VDFKDYYKVMGVKRDANQDEIKQAYRKLARKYHPDINKAADSEARFKELGEAYAVLKDAKKRAAYDELGANWQSGQEFRPPPDWDAGYEFSGSGIDPADAASYSDFFESLFGQRTRERPGTRSRGGFKVRGEDHHARVLVDIEDAYSGATRAITLQTTGIDESGHVVNKSRTLNIKIPKGVIQGQRIRLQGQGAPGIGDGGSGDLYLEIDFQPHRLYTHDGRDIYLKLPVKPWEAALGATIKVPTPVGSVDLKLPPDSKNGKKLRLKGRGIPGKPVGDLFVTVEITLPPANSDQSKEFYKKMQQEMEYNPRASLEV
jgi:curved DNA-binding protein